MKKLVTAVAGFTVLGAANPAFAEPAEVGSDRGAYCDWPGTTVPSGPPGTLFAWRGQNAPGVVAQNAARGIETYLPGTLIRLSDDQVGAAADWQRGFYYRCNIPTPTP